MSNPISADAALPAVIRQQRVKRKLRKVTFPQIYITASIFYLLFLLVSAVAPQLLTHSSPTAMNASELLQPPSGQHWLGTDHFGRDLWTVLVYGSRQSLLLGVTSVLIGGFAGLVLGLVAGYFGGVVDTLLMRLTDVLMTIPGTLLAIVIAVAIGPTYFNVILAISIATIPSKARVIRSTVIGLRNRMYVDAARAVGTSHLQIMLRHILPGCWSPILVMTTIGVGTSILAGTGLSFLGLGVIKEIPDWGYLLSEGRSYMTVAWWIAAFPGLFITLLVVAFNLLGDELRDRLDPKHQ